LILLEILMCLFALLLSMCVICGVAFVVYLRC
jgi:hypothetical protein